MTARSSKAAALPTETRLDDDTSKPATVAPGDAPHDTTDPTERAVSVIPGEPSPEAIAAGTQNAVIPVPADTTERDDSNDRVDEYTVEGPDGKPVKIRHNVDTGVTERI